MKPLVCVCVSESALANVTWISQHAHRRALCHVFLGVGGGGGDWTHLSYRLASHECVTVKRNKVYLKRTRRHGSSGLAPLNRDPNQVSEIITISRTEVTISVFLSSYLHIFSKIIHFCTLHRSLHAFLSNLSLQILAPRL